MHSTESVRLCRGVISELLRQSDATQLRSLFSVLRECDDVFVRTALIRALGNCADTELTAEAIALFEAIPFSEREGVAVNVTMNALINDGRKPDAPSLF